MKLKYDIKLELSSDVNRLRPYDKGAYLPLRVVDMAADGCMQVVVSFPGGAGAGLGLEGLATLEAVINSGALRGLAVRPARYCPPRHTPHLATPFLEVISIA